MTPQGRARSDNALDANEPAMTHPVGLLEKESPSREPNFPDKPVRRGRVSLTKYYDIPYRAFFPISGNDQDLVSRDKGGAHTA